MIRQGACNRCGQCCGAEGSPYQNSPWPDCWPGAYSTWDLDYLQLKIPIFALSGSPAHGGASAGAILFNSMVYRWIWVPDHGLCKDEMPYGDPSAFSEECPFLMPDPGDGTRPCALVGTVAEPIWQQLCEPEPTIEKTPEKVTQWQERHPLCSYTWVEE